MNKPRRLLAFLLSAMLLTGSAFAAVDLTQYSITDATVAAVSFTDVFAPCSGTLGAFDLEAGDSVKDGDVLVSMLTTDVTVPERGKVAAVFASAGNDAADVMLQYGMIAAVEPELPLRVRASISGAHDAEENRTIHIGETVYLKDGGTTAVGKVIAVNGKNYEVEITEGTFDIDKQPGVFRSSAHTARSKIGKGIVYRRNPVAITAVGRIAEMLVDAGDTVEAGQIVCRVLSADAPAGTVPAVSAEANGVIASIAVMPGQQVWRGQQLMRIWNTDRLEVTAQVDEMDLHGLKAGDPVIVTLDTDPSEIIRGTVTEISGAAVQVQNAACFTVHAEITSASARIGSGASLYLQKE